MKLGQHKTFQLKTKLALTFFHNTNANGGISLWEKVHEEVIEKISEMVWGKTNFNNGNKDYIILYYDTRE